MSGDTAGGARPRRLGPATRVVAVVLAVLAAVMVAGPDLAIGDLRGAAGAGSLPKTGTGTTAVAAAAPVAPLPTAPPEPGPPADDDPDTAPEAPGPQALAFVDQTDWVGEGAPFDLRLAVGADVRPEDEVVLDLHAPITSRSQFAATRDGALLGPRRAEVVLPVAALVAEPDGTRRVRLTQAPTDAPGEVALPALAREGVYPLVVGLRRVDPDAPPPAPFTTYLVRTPAEAPTPFRVAVVQPVGAPPAHRPDGAIDLDPDEIAELGALAEVLAGDPATPLTIAPRPETLEALARLAVAGDGEPRRDAAAAVLEALTTAAAGRQVVSRPYVDLNLDALEAAGLGDDVATQRMRGDEVVERTLGVRTDARTWVDDRGASPRALRRLAELGVDRVVLPDEALSAVDLRLTLARPFTIASAGEGFEMEAAAPDPALAEHAGGANVALAAQHLLTDLAVLHGDEPGPLSPRGVVVGPPADEPTDPRLLAAVLEGIATSPILEPVTLDRYFSEVEAQGGTGEPLLRQVTPSGGSLAISAADVAAVRARLGGYESMVAGDPGAARQLGDLLLLAEAAGLDPATRRAYLAAATAGIERRLGAIRVVDRASFRLPDSEGTIPLTLVREGDTPVTVTVRLESDKLAFGDGDDPQLGAASYDVDLESENTPLVVPVRVLSPGTFPLFVTITSPDGSLQVLRTQVTIRSTAFSGVGVALSAISGVFLLLWWGRHWRTVRRARHLVPVA